MWHKCELGLSSTFVIHQSSVLFVFSTIQETVRCILVCDVLPLWDLSSFCHCHELCSLYSWGGGGGGAGSDPDMSGPLAFVLVVYRLSLIAVNVSFLDVRLLLVFNGQ